MSKESNNDEAFINETKESPSGDNNVGKVDLSIDIPREEYVICKVCGHKNKSSDGLCEMCSNYLFV